MTQTDDKTPRVWLLSANIMNQLGGGFRQQRWCEYYLRRGYSVRLFYVSGVSVVRWVDVHSEDELRTKRREWLAAVQPQAGVRDGQAAYVSRFVKHTLLLDLFLPSVIRLLFLLNSMKAKTTGVTILLCSSPPYAMAVVGAVMRAWWGSRIFMALDMRDLWSIHSAFPGPKAHKRLLERWVINKADDFTTVSGGLADRFEAAFRLRPQVVYNVATHAHPFTGSVENYNWNKWSSRLRSGSLKVLYTGSVPHGFYDLDSFVDAVQDFATTTEHAVERVQFVFVGAGGELSARVEAAALPADIFVFLPQTTHEKVAEMQTAADVLLFLGHRAADNQGQVSIKLFEYLARKKPIFPVSIKRGSDVDNIVTMYCGDCPCIVDKTAITQALNGVIECGPDSLPRSRNENADVELLDAYQTSVSRILASVR